MKLWIGVLIGMSLQGADLIQISNDASMAQLQALDAKYQQPLVMEGEKVYLIPASCRMDRYFGGASTGILTLVHLPSYTEAIPMTQEVFDAKESTQIVKKIEQEKVVAIAEAKVSRAFLEDKEGRGFGGASQIPLDFSSEKVQVLQNTSSQASVPTQPLVLRQTAVPQCVLLEDGSGYRIESPESFSVYRNGAVKKLINNTIHYE